MFLTISEINDITSFSSYFFDNDFLFHKVAVSKLDNSVPRR